VRLKAAITGDLREVVGKEMAAAGKAIRAGLREAGNGMKKDYNAEMRRAGLGKLARVWRVRVYRGKRGPMDAFGIVYPNGGERTREAIWAYEHGATIRAKNAKYLLIPTSFNRQRGRRGGKVIYTPDQLKDSFVQQSKDGTLMLFARVQRAQMKQKGIVRNRAFVNSHMLGGGRVKRSEEILRYGSVPMFVLVPQVQVQKRLRLSSITARWQRRAPELILKHWEAQSGGKSS
jgi:hypothetical protein